MPFTWLAVVATAFLVVRRAMIIMITPQQPQALSLLHNAFQLIFAAFPFSAAASLALAQYDTIFFFIVEQDEIYKDMPWLLEAEGMILL